MDLPLLRSPVPALLDSLAAVLQPVLFRFEGAPRTFSRHPAQTLSKINFYSSRDPQLDVDQQSKVQSRLLKSKVGSYLDTFTATRHVWQHSVQR